MEVVEPCLSVLPLSLHSSPWPESDWWPKHIVESAWTEHTPFAAWLIQSACPSVVVELGTHRGVSYLAFCQAAARLFPVPRCFAVDTWQGDEHTGAYDPTIHGSLSALNAARYADFSTLLRMRFSEALDRFSDGSVDILHIDGFHTYEAVSDGFYTWLPKMSRRGIVLFHDTEVRERDFGVWRLWEEVSGRYPSFHFLHGNGLGIIAVGIDQPAGLAQLFGADEVATARIRKTFAARGKAVSGKHAAMSAPPAARGPNGSRPAHEPLVLQSRKCQLLAEATQETRILEIGPSHAPIAPRSAGWNTTVVDHADREGLAAKYRNDVTVDTSCIEEVDFVWTGGPLDALIPRNLHGSFDLLIASHVVEHFPDPVGVLRAAEQLLRPDTGMISLAVPDKRTCFDFFRPLSTTGKMLAAHRDSRSRHLSSDIFDGHAYMAALNGQTGWGWQNAEMVRPLHPIALAHQKFLEADETPEAPYEDCHGWVFTPASFELIILELGELGVIDWRVEKTMPQAGVEFIVHLHRGRRLFTSSEAFEAYRLEVLREVMRDLHLQAKAFLANAEGKALPTSLESGIHPAVSAYRAFIPLKVRRLIARLRGRIP